MKWTEYMGVLISENARPIGSNRFGHVKKKEGQERLYDYEDRY